ncbi:MAG: hypothetical protein CM1200mP18_00720 [Gammaproteobacteria bacterium]|nr:MAG: hypothetical protein CM1200mP18_00720 [Gammaproteobacteria bacterium]
MMFMDLTIRLVIVYDMPENAKSDAVNDINQALKSGHLCHRVAAEFSLDDIADSQSCLNKVL